MADERFLVEVCGRAVPAVATAAGVRAVGGGTVINPEAVAAYLEGKFGDDHKPVRAAMVRVAKSYPPAELKQVAYSLYERFRPAVPEGRRGWVKGPLDLDRLADLARPAPARR